MTNPICKNVLCNVINQELAFYEDAHCMLDNEPGIRTTTDGFLSDFGYDEMSELKLLGRHPISSALWRSYSKLYRDDINLSGEDWLDAHYVFFGAGRMTAFFYGLFNDPGVPVRFKEMRGKFGEIGVLRFGDEPRGPIDIFFNSSTDLPLPSPQATELTQFLTKKLRAAGIMLPRDFMIEKHVNADFPGKIFYKIFIPMGDCNET